MIPHVVTIGLTDSLAEAARTMADANVGMDRNESRSAQRPGLRIEDSPLDDPEGQTLDRVRAIRDEIRRRLADLVAREG